MSDWTISEVRLTGGVMHARISGPDGARPALRASHLGTIVEGLEVSDQGAGVFDLSLAVPPAMITDGVQTLLIVDTTPGAEEEVLTSVTLIAGDVLAEDIRAEMTLLREELDMLKRAFRRHAADRAD